MRRLSTSSIRDLARIAIDFWLWPAVLLIGFIAFFSVPGDYVGTATAVLHGLCAQTPSHTLLFGNRPLPFDARMTGIYGGFAVTIVWMVFTGRLFSYGNPPRRVVAILTAFVVGMAIDGTNSLTHDLGLSVLYEPGNVLRVITGYGTGIALAVAMSWLLASCLWRLSTSDSSIHSMKELAMPIAGFAIFGGLLWWRPVWLHPAMAIALVASAWLAISILALVGVLLVSRLDDGINRIQQLHFPVATASILAIVIMLVLAGARFWAEYHFGITNTFT